MTVKQLRQFGTHVLEEMVDEQAARPNKGLKRVFTAAMQKQQGSLKFAKRVFRQATFDELLCLMPSFPSS